MRAIGLPERHRDALYGGAIQTLSLAAQCIVIGPVCLQRAGGRAGVVCLCLCESVTRITIDYYLLKVKVKIVDLYSASIQSVSMALR